MSRFKGGDGQELEFPRVFRKVEIGTVVGL
jgi:hypothetical protein